MPDAVCCVCSSCSAAPPAAASSPRHNRSAVLQLIFSILLHYRPYRETREHLDDLVQRIIGPISRIQHHLEAAGLFVLRGLRDAGFTVSPKTTLVTTDRRTLSLDGCVPSCRLSKIVHCLCGRCWYRSRPCHHPSNSETHKALQGCSPPCQENLPTCQEPHERAHHQYAGHHGHAPLSHLLQQAVGNGTLAIGPPQHCHRESDHAQESGSLPYYHAGHRHGRK